jgi:uncharacterized membrane protein
MTTSPHTATTPRPVGRPGRRRRRSQTLWGVMAVVGVGVAVFSPLPYLTGDPSQSTIPLNPGTPISHYVSIVVHGLPSSLALLIGPFQFSSRLRSRYPTLHRSAGRVYMICIVIGLAAAVFATVSTVSGFTAQVGFAILIVAWAYTLVRAYQTIRRGEVALHRIWMIRNYALTFAAVTLRVYVLALGLLMPDLPFEQLYTAAVWASVLGNVLVAEYFIVNRTLAPLARR